MLSMFRFSACLLLGLSLALGCSRPAAPEANNVVASSEPPGAKGVLELRKDAKDGDNVVIVGRVGGSKAPILEGAVAFTIVDTSFKPCNEKEDDACPTPWDYCCDPKDKLAQATATIKVLDAEGNTLSRDARQFLGIKELNTVVIRGKARRDRQGNLTVLADQVYVKK